MPRQLDFSGMSEPRKNKVEAMIPPKRRSQKAFRLLAHSLPCRTQEDIAEEHEYPEAGSTECWLLRNVTTEGSRMCGGPHASMDSSQSLAPPPRSSPVTTAPRAAFAHPSSGRFSGSVPEATVTFFLGRAHTSPPKWRGAFTLAFNDLQRWRTRISASFGGLLSMRFFGPLNGGRRKKCP